MPNSPTDPLREYREKRAEGETPEPFGGARSTRPGLFVVQRHAATSLHYDLRLEHKGVLLSWAVPKGPSPDPETKRLAVHTEDHPVEYADFEGEIPPGNYGAGWVTVWDQGSWHPLEDPDEGLRKGKLLFELRGHKLGGVWTLFRTGRKDGDARQWLLMKKPDGWAEDEPAWPEHSILSGLTVEELRDGAPRLDALRVKVAATGAPKRAVDPAKARPMLARLDDAPFSDPAWLYELKYDGYRLLLSARDGDARLFYRSGREATRLYPELLRSLRALPFSDVLVDGEVVVLDAANQPDFQALQKRAQLHRPLDIDRASVARPVVCFAFDLLAFEGTDLRGLPLETRKRLLAELLPPVGPLRYSDHVAEKGEQVYASVRKLGLEGVIAKRAASPYRAGRQDDWRKFKAERTGDFAVVGWTAPKGARTGLGALHLAAREGDEWAYLGRVGTGFTDRDLEDLRARLGPLERETPPCSGPVPQSRGHHWTDPVLVAEVRYLMRTDDGLLRHPAFLRLREDKDPAECAAPPRRGAEPQAPPAPPEKDAAVDRHFEPTNTDKVFWPDEGYTKGDLLAYYRAIAPRLVPYLRDRPVVLVRYPDGIRGKNFFQKDAPEWIPDWVRTERMWSEQTQRDIDYFVCDDAESLLYLINMGTIPLHIWSSRITAPGRPDWCVLDLDPKEAPFSQVVTVAKAVHELCREIGWDAAVKTSGSSGLHVLLPLGGQCTYEQSRQLGELLARIVEARIPDLATTTRARDRRGGRVYLDYLQNGSGRLIAAPYSVRPLPGAPVSCPLSWREVNGSLSIAQFDLRTVPERYANARKRDPCRAVLTATPDLAAVLSHLSDRLDP